MKDSVCNEVPLHNIGSDNLPSGRNGTCDLIIQSCECMHVHNWIFKGCKASFYCLPTQQVRLLTQ